MVENDREPYLVDAVVRATKVLDAFTSSGESLRLRDVVERTGLNKGLCFRLLYTLHQCGFVEKVEVNRYRIMSDARRRKRFRIGYAAQGESTSFPREVLAGLQRAADQANVELIVVSNRYQPKVAIRNAQQLVRQGIDLVIEFQTDESAAPAVAAPYLEAGIPLIAIDIPHPGATYFGANNYQAGLLAGRHLGRWAKSQWRGEADELLLVELERAGSVVRSRITGVLAGFRESLPEAVESCRVTRIDGDGQFKVAVERVRSHLRTSKAKHLLVGAANDASALGAVRAFQEAGRAASCAIVGQNAEPDARAELRQPRTPLVATIGYFPEKYGDGLLRLALDILGHKAVPPAVFVKHQTVTRDNVDHLYPNDSLLAVAPTF